MGKGRNKKTRTCCKRSRPLINFFVEQRSQHVQSKNNLTHCIMVDSSTVIYWSSLFAILEVSGLFCRFNSIQLANNVDSDQTHVASDHGLHCVSLTL